MNRLQQRLTRIERATLPAGRMCVVIDDGSDDIEARIERCRAETSLSDRDLVVILKPFFQRAPGRLKNRPGRCGPWLASAMFARIRDRVVKLEEQIAPQGRAPSCSLELRGRISRPMPITLRHSRQRTALARTTPSTK